MNEAIQKQVELHLAEYSDDTPIDTLEHLEYIKVLFEIYEQRYIVTWIHTLLIAWVVANVAAGIVGLWFVWLPLISIAVCAVVFRIVTRE